MQRWCQRRSMPGKYIQRCYLVHWCLLWENPLSLLQSLHYPFSIQYLDKVLLQLNTVISIYIPPKLGNPIQPKFYWKLLNSSRSSIRSICFECLKGEVRRKFIGKFRSLAIKFAKISACAQVRVFALAGLGVIIVFWWNTKEVVLICFILKKFFKTYFLDYYLWLLQSHSHSSTENFLSPILVSNWLIFCSENSMLQITKQQKNANKSTSKHKVAFFALNSPTMTHDVTCSKI